VLLLEKNKRIIEVMEQKLQKVALKKDIVPNICSGQARLQHIVKCFG